MMMDKYYYIISQMPDLRFDSPASVDAGRFLTEAEKWLSQKELHIIGGTRLFDREQTGHVPRVYREYRRFEAALRADIAAWREARVSGGDYKPALFPVTLVTEGNPLEIEKKLLKLRWDFLEEAMFGHHFDMGFLILYFLQLQILGKLAEYEQKTGLEIYRETVSVDMQEHLDAAPASEHAGQR